MGGRIGYALANAAPERLLTLIIGGAHPYAVDQAQWRQTAEVLRTGGMLAMLTGFEQQMGRWPEDQRARFLANDAASLSASAWATSTFPGATEHLAGFGRRTLIYCGDNDPSSYVEAQRAATLMPRATFVTLPGLNHMQGFAQIDKVIPHIRAFLGNAADTPGA